MESKAVMSCFFHFLFFRSRSRGCSWTPMLERTFGRRHACGWRLRCSQILGCGCLLSHEGGGRIQRVFLTPYWLEMANVFTCLCHAYKSCVEFCFHHPPNPPRSDSLEAFTSIGGGLVFLSLLLSFSIVTSLHCGFFPQAICCPIHPAHWRLCMVGNLSHVSFKLKKEKS